MTTEGLGERGQAIYTALSGNDAARNALVLEAARTADRLDELDNIIQGKGVLNLMQFRVLDREQVDGVVSLDIEVKFQNVLSEARQQQTTLASLIKTLGAEGLAAAAPPAAVKTGADMLAEMREKRKRGGGV